MVSTPAGAAVRLPAATQSDAVATGKRLYFFDNLRVALVMLVIAHHVGQAYGPTGGSWPIMEAARSPILGPFFTVNRSFFMSLFFMISGYFAVMSFDSSGPQRFVKSRLQRLGLPVLVWAVVITVPFQVFVQKIPAWPVDVGHLWFIEHLLIFSLVYALWRVLTRGRTHAERAPLNPPGVLATLGLALAIAVVSGVVREVYPIDRWEIYLGFVKVMWADVPRDLAFFIVGLLAYRNGWVLKFPTRAGLAWLAVGVALVLYQYAYELGFTGNLVPTTGLAAGVLRLLWEGVFVCAICIGLTVLFREVLNIGGRLSRTLSQAQYAAYILHIPIVLLVQFAVLRLPLPPLAKFAVVTLVAIPLTFAFSSWARKPLRL